MEKLEKRKFGFGCWLGVEGVMDEAGLWIFSGSVKEVWLDFVRQGIKI